MKHVVYVSVAVALVIAALVVVGVVLPFDDIMSILGIHAYGVW